LVCFLDIFKLDLVRLFDFNFQVSGILGTCEVMPEFAEGVLIFVASVGLISLVVVATFLAVSLWMRLKGQRERHRVYKQRYMARQRQFELEEQRATENLQRQINRPLIDGFDTISINRRVPSEERTLYRVRPENVLGATSLLNQTASVVWFVLLWNVEFVLMTPSLSSISGEFFALNGF